MAECSERAEERGVITFTLISILVEFFINLICRSARSKPFYFCCSCRQKHFTEAFWTVQSPAEQKENKKEITKFIIKSISKMKRAVGSSACMPVRRPAPLSAAHYFNAPSTPHSGHFAISPSASGWVVTSRRGLHVSAPVGAAKVNPRNMNQAVRKDMQSIEAVRKRHDELRKQKQLEQEEAAGVRHHHPFPSRLLCRARVRTCVVVR